MFCVYEVKWIRFAWITEKDKLSNVVLRKYIDASTRNKFTILFYFSLLRAQIRGYSSWSVEDNDKMARNEIVLRPETLTE